MLQVRLAISIDLRYLNTQMNCDPMMTGPVILFGSGETSASAQATYHRLFTSLRRPIRVAILETPAGFELNSDRVAGKVATFIKEHLQNFGPETIVVPARRRDTSFSPDDPDIVAPLLSSNVIYMGAGSPTYAVRQLRDSLAWHTLTARHRLGANVVLASASVLAASAYAIPVYEIYKVGEDVHWKAGLDLLGPYGLSLAFVPHWNNTEGGTDLDTSRCFMGLPRFAQLLNLLPDTVTVVGIDEHTALTLDLNSQTCQVVGRGGVTLLRHGDERRFDSDERPSFPITELGSFHIPGESTGIPVDVWEWVRAAAAPAERTVSPTPTPEVLDLMKKRQLARTHRDWHTADSIRDQINDLGWHVRDTPSGPKLVPADH
jgi:cyanophycinase-like exopeptidase